MYYTPDLSKLMIIADFDGTLTQAYAHGHKTPSLTHLLTSTDCLSHHLSEQLHFLYQHYRPLEYDPTLDFGHKTLLMEERWTKVKHLMIQEKLHKQHIEIITHADYMLLRPGVPDMFTFAQIHHIPIIIISASGVGYDTIYEYLQYRNLRSDNVTIISNQCIRDTDGTMIDFSRPIIHSLNKSGQMITSHPNYHIRKEKTDILLLGDNVHDIQMSQGISYSRQYSIGRCNENKDTNLPVYQNTFDHVITDDGPMNNVIGRLQSATDYHSDL